MPIRDYGQAIDRSFQPGQITTLDDAQLWAFMNGMPITQTNPGGILFFGLGVISLGNLGQPGGGVLNQAIANNLALAGFTPPNSQPQPTSQPMAMPTQPISWGWGSSKVNSNTAVINPLPPSGTPTPSPGLPPGTPAGTTPRFEGVAYASDTFEIINGYSRDSFTGLLGYPRQQVISSVRQGVVAVWIDSAVNRGDAAACRLALNTGTPATTITPGAPITFGSNPITPTATTLSGNPNNSSFLPPQPFPQQSNFFQSTLPPINPPAMPGCFRAAAGLPANDPNFLIIPNNAYFIVSSPAPPPGYMGIGYLWLSM